jgi:nucleoid-associated protein YgaU
MSLLSFIKDAGEKLFRNPQVEPAQTTVSAAPQQGTSAPVQQVDVAALNAKAGDAIRVYVEQQKLGISNLDVKYEGATQKVTISGQAPSREAAEKAVLCCGNVAHVASVDNQLTLAQAAQPEQAARYHDVAKGDTLSAISKKYYGDPNKYHAIFEANRPMLTNPDKIYPGQKLRIPALA